MRKRMNKQNRQNNKNMRQNRRKDNRANRGDCNLFQRIINRLFGRRGKRQRR